MSAWSQGFFFRSHRKQTMSPDVTLFQLIQTSPGERLKRSEEANIQPTNYVRTFPRTTKQLTGELRGRFRIREMSEHSRKTRMTYSQQKHEHEYPR